MRVRVCVFLTSTTTGFFITYILSLSILLSFLLLLLAYLFPLGPFQLLPLSSSFLSSESWLLLLLLLSLSRSQQLCSCFQFYGPALTPVRQGSVTGKENKKSFVLFLPRPLLRFFATPPKTHPSVLYASQWKVIFFFGNWCAHTFWRRHPRVLLADSEDSRSRVFYY